MAQIQIEISEKTTEALYRALFALWLTRHCPRWLLKLNKNTSSIKQLSSFSIVEKYFPESVFQGLPHNCVGVWGFPLDYRPDFIAATDLKIESE